MGHYSYPLNDERKRLIEQAREIVAADRADEPPKADVLDAALTHLIESHAQLEEHRNDHPPDVVKELCNTSVIGMHYRTAVESKWR